MEGSAVIVPMPCWVEIRYVGRITVSALKQLADDLVALKNWSPLTPRLFDYEAGLMGDLGFIEAGTGLLPFYKAREQALYGAGPVYQAHLCSDPLKQVLVHYWTALGEANLPVRNRLFDQRAAAEAWLRELTGGARRPA